jgi:hypothetical protein
MSAKGTGHFNENFLAKGHKRTDNNNALMCEMHYVYPCQRFSTGNTIEDYNP